jgi:hypothetical protein
MSKLKIPAALLVIGTMSLGGPAIAAPVTPLSLSATAKQLAQESDLVQVRFGRWHIGWHGWGGWHGGRYRCRPYCGWGG